MLRQLLLLCLLLSTIQVQAEDFVGVQYVRAYDADTLTVNLKNLPSVFGEELGIRVAGIDAPEIRGKCAQEEQMALQARDRVRELLEQAQQIDLVDVERDKYFRVVAKVKVDGRDLSQLLLEEGHAVTMMVEPSPRTGVFWELRNPCWFGILGLRGLLRSSFRFCSVGDCSSIDSGKPYRLVDVSAGSFCC